MFRALLDKIKQGLVRTRDLFAGIASLFRLRGKVDKDFLTELEKRLYDADVGTVATAEIVDKVRQAFLDKEITGDVEAFVAAVNRLIEDRALRAAMGRQAKIRACSSVGRATRRMASFRPSTVSSKMSPIWILASSLRITSGVMGRGFGESSGLSGSSLRMSV